jgi:hypothetical protein
MRDERLIRPISPFSQQGEQDERKSIAENRRRYERYEAAKSLVVIPVMPDGSLDWERRRAGYSVNVSKGGLGIEVDHLPQELPSSLLVGVEGDDGQTHFAGVKVCFSKPGMSRSMYVGTTFGGQGADFLLDGKLRPQFNAQSLTLEYALAQSTLDDCVSVGVLNRVLCDQVQLCPRCCSLPTFRNGCRKCGSARVKRDELIHHFACAHVDLAAAFQRNGQLACPKCRTSRLVVGADFEYLEGQYQCLDCRWQDSSLESIAHCLKCNYRFAALEAEVQDVYTYTANRLNWRELIDSTKPLDRK